MWGIMDSRGKFEEQQDQSSSENRGEDSNLVTREKEEYDIAQAAVGEQDMGSRWGGGG